MSLFTRIFGTYANIPEFAEVAESLGRLKDLTNKLEQMDTEVHDKLGWLQRIFDSIEVPVWAKDADNRFVYANKACCDMILHCSIDEVLEATDTDFEGAALADVCIQSDEITKARGETCRFIEHSVFADYELWLDTVKSPWYKDGEVIGTVGTGKNITDIIPEEIRSRFREPAFIEIPVDIHLNSEHVEKLVLAQIL